MDCRINNNEEFISICVPVFNRPEYINRLIDSIFKFADTPFELIIHDDGSTDGATKELLKRRNDISTIILNNGHQLGLAESIHRCIEIASSEWICFLNADCVFNRRFLRDLVNVLSKEYVGWVGLTDFGEFNEKLVSDDTYFSLKSGMGSGCAFAFRKSSYDQVGGFDVDCRSGCGDTPLQLRYWSKGYFRATMDGDKAVRNLSQEEKGNKDSSIGKTGYDTSLPIIFNCKSYSAWCKERWNKNENRFREHEDKYEHRGNTLTDMSFWNDFSRRLIPEDHKINKINWDGEGHTYNHNRWRDEIEKDFKKK